MPLLKHERHALNFLLTHLLYGTIGGFLFGFLLLWQDVGGIFTLARDSDDTVLIVGMLFFGLFVTFGAVGMAIGIMSLGEDTN